MTTYITRVCILLACTSGITFGFSRRNAITDPDHLWPAGRVPYVFDAEVDAYRKVHMLAGMKQVMLSTYSGETPCVLFVPRTDEADYVHFRFALDNLYSGSDVGREGGEQMVQIGHPVTQDNIVQLLMFVLGIHPEISRPDRDDYLEINRQNINPEYAGNFDIEEETDVFEQPFDYNTVVMYGPYFGAVNRSTPTITTKYDGFTLGQTVSLSDNDVNLVQHIYECPLDASNAIDVLGNLEFECHFHEDMCGFTQDNEDDFDWTYIQGPTASLSGPEADHSSGTGGYVVAISAEHPNQLTRLTTPRYPAGIYCFVLWVYMHGPDTGKLKVIQINRDGDKTLIEIEAQPEAGWYHGSANVISADSNVWVSVEAFMGNGEQGDIAIDDIYIYDGRCIDWF